MSSIEYELMFKLFHAENILKHFVQLLLAQNTLGRALIEMSARMPPRCNQIRATMLFVVSKNAVELAHPRGEHGLLAQAVDLGQAAHTLLNVVLEDVAKVNGGAATRAHHLRHTVGLEEDLVVAAHSVRERLVRLHAAHLVLQKQVEVVLDRVQLLLGDLELTPHHVRGLLGYERIGYAAAHEHVYLQFPLVKLLLFHCLVFGSQRQGVNLFLFVVLPVSTASFFRLIEKLH